MKYFIKINDVAQPMITKNRLLFDMLTGEEQPQSMAGLLLTLVLVLHLAGFYIVNINTSATVAKPIKLMEVSMVAVPLPVADVPPPIPAPPEPPKPEPPKPVPPKPVVKPKPVIKKPIIPKTEPVLIPVAKEPMPLPPKPVFVPTPAPVKSAPAPVKAAPAAPKPQTFTQASVGANYGYNPKPKYPSVARSRGWVGKVILRVQVSADGEAQQVSVAQSSGHDILDDAAVAAVEGWRFVPAKRGDTAVASTVNVPINFTLN
jgi:protein TonB